MADSLNECEDFSAFQEILKNLRKTDDIIVSTINSAIPTDSFHSDIVSVCKNIHSNIEEGHNKREKFIKNCISVTTDSVKMLRAEKETHPDDRQIVKKLKAEQTKLRMLQVELTVEDLIKERSAKVFNERCRTYYKPL